MINIWAAEWHSNNRLDGDVKHILYGNDGFPALFHTRAEARNHIKENYGYIATRPDLRQEPHGWKMPKAVKVIVTVEAERAAREAKNNECVGLSLCTELSVVKEQIQRAERERIAAEIERIVDENYKDRVQLWEALQKLIETLRLQ